MFLEVFHREPVEHATRNGAFAKTASMSFHTLVDVVQVTQTYNLSTEYASKNKCKKSFCSQMND